MTTALLRGRRARDFPSAPCGRRWASAVLAGFALAACGGDPSGPTGGGPDTSSDVPLSADFELQVAADETVAEATIEDVALRVAADRATVRGRKPGSGSAGPDRRGARATPCERPSSRSKDVSCWRRR